MDTLAKEYPELAKNVKPIFVSVDPARDSLKALKEYGKDLHPSYVFLTGSPDQVQQMAKKYRVYVSKVDETEDGDYLVDHSFVIYFHDDAGDLADCFNQSMWASDVVEKVVERMNFVSIHNKQKRKLKLRSSANRGHLQTSANRRHLRTSANRGTRSRRR